MDTIWIFFSFVSGTGIGFFIHEFVAPVINHKLAQKRNIESAQVTNFIKQYNTFQEVIIPTLQSLTKPEGSLVQIISTEFPKHELAMLTFIDVLKTDSERHSRFNKVWSEYEDAYKKCNQYEEFDMIEYSLSLINRPDFVERMTAKDKEKFLKFKEKTFTSYSTNKKYIHSLLSNLIEIAHKY